MSTKERLAKEMKHAGCPETLIARARAGEFDVVESPHDAPIIKLTRELAQSGFYGLAYRAMRGEFDATKAEECRHA